MAVAIFRDVTPCIWEIISNVLEQSVAGSSETLVMCFWQ